MTFLLRSMIRGIPWLFGITAAIVFGIFFAGSLRSNTGFALMLQSTRLVFPTTGLQPPFSTAGAWLLDIAYLLLTATWIGLVTRSPSWIRRALLAVAVVIVVAVVVQLLLWVVGYRYVFQIEL